ncbi:binding partner of ACD11 1 [Dendrobium catenatum]|uniref:RRM domain-containing protein n=1 Tax=Dendrobium catenatum TaxID=906689 RepID=A0A2I0WTN5_9ASPA|nr:binding partner of ACD11 1 [Dendrobium catenatum]PKU79025.1 hypothetical protein MA16_Dca000369 [Dendrobium catenatum]
MSAKTVKVSNISLLASQQDVREFFSFSGDIVYVEMQSEPDGSWLAYVTFKDTQGADTAVLLSGATIADRVVTVTYADNYKLPPEACQTTTIALEDSTVKRAEDIVSSMIAKSLVLGKDALHSAKSFDENHHIISTATATVASIDRRFGLSEKISMGTAMVNEKMLEVDKRYQVSEMTRSAIAAAEQKASTASSAVMGNHYVSTGASWISNALNRVARAAEDVTLMTREKVEKVEDEKNEIIYRERKEMVSEFVQFHLDDSFGEPATVPVASADEHNIGRV